MKEIAIKNVECKVSVVDKVKNAVASWLHTKNHFLSSVIEEDVTNLQVLLAFHFLLSILVVCGSSHDIPQLLAATAYSVFAYLLAKKGADFK